MLHSILLIDMGEIYLIRHAESDANRRYRNAKKHSRRIVGLSMCSPLTMRGRLQAIALGENLAIAGTEFSAIYHSGILRARQTAELCAIGMKNISDKAGPELVEDPRLRELSMGRLEGMLVDKAYAIWKPKNFWEDAPPEGESQRQVYERMLEWLGEARPEHGKIAAFSHGGPIAYLLKEIIGEDSEWAFRLRKMMKYTQITIIDYEKIDCEKGKYSVGMEKNPHLVDAK